MEYNYEPLKDFNDVILNYQFELTYDIAKKGLDKKINLNSLKIENDFFNSFEVQFSNLRIMYQTKINNCNNLKHYFFGCSIENYKAHFENRLKSFLENNFILSVNDFIHYELNKTFENMFFFEAGFIDTNQKFCYSVLGLNYENKIKTNIIERNKFLNDKINSLSTLETIEPKAKDLNPFPLLFTTFEVYNCFLEYTKKHIIEFYSDYSYLKKRLENQKLIHNHKDNDFINIVFNDMKLIKKSDYDNYFTKYDSKLKSLSKSHNIQRENNFNTIFEGLI
jgi:hypothetical protein